MVLDVNKPSINIGELLQILNAQVTKPLELKIEYSQYSHGYGGDLSQYSLGNGGDLF